MASVDDRVLVGHVCSANTHIAWIQLKNRDDFFRQLCSRDLLMMTKSFWIWRSMPGFSSTSNDLLRKIVIKFLTRNLKACARDSHFILLFIFYHALLGFEIVRFSISLWEHVIGTVIYDSPSASEEILKDLNQCISWASCQIHKIASCACTGNAGNVSPPPRVSDPDMHHGTCVTHGPWCMPRSLTRGFLWSHWWGKRSRHSRRMRNPQYCVSGKRLMKTRREIM